MVALRRRAGTGAKRAGTGACPYTHPRRAAALRANVYADVSALYGRPWQFYNSMVLAQEYGVLHKLLFGSDYPFTTPAGSLEGLRTVNRFTKGTDLPCGCGVPRCLPTTMQGPLGLSTNAYDFGSLCMPVFGCIFTGGSGNLAETLWLRNKDQ